MINIVHRHGKNSIEKAIAYLKSDHDHKGTSRSVKPRDLAGSASDCEIIASTIDRKHKYISGTLSFRDDEKPTDKELQAIIKQFRAVFMSGLEDSINYVDYWNIHEDKGHLELNYIIPMTELTTGKALNPFPPGKGNYAHKDAFDAYINHQLGYDQVVRNPLKASESKFEKKVLPYATSELANQISATKPDKDTISLNVGYQILNGKISSRQQLCDYLENFGEITRINDKFISLKINGAPKAFRLSGPVYEYGADFKQLKNEFLTKESPHRKQLNDADFQKVKLTLGRLTKARKVFNQKMIATPMTGRSNKNRLYGDKALAKKLASVKEVQQAPQNAPTQAQAPLTNPTHMQAPVIAQKPPTAGKPATKDSPSKDSGSSGSTSMGSSSDSSIGNLQAQLSDLRNQIANTKDPAKVASLKVRAMKLEQQIGAAVEADRIRKLKETSRFSGIKKKY